MSASIRKNPLWDKVQAMIEASLDDGYEDEDDIEMDKKAGSDSDASENSRRAKSKKEKKKNRVIKDSGALKIKEKEAQGKRGLTPRWAQIQRMMGEARQMRERSNNPFDDSFSDDEDTRATGTTMGVDDNSFFLWDGDLFPSLSAQEEFSRIKPAFMNSVSRWTACSDVSMAGFAKSMFSERDERYNAAKTHLVTEAEKHNAVSTTPMAETPEQEPEAQRKTRSFPVISPPQSVVEVPLTPEPGPSLGKIRSAPIMNLNYNPVGNMHGNDDVSLLTTDKFSKGCFNPGLFFFVYLYMSGTIYGGGLIVSVGMFLASFTYVSPFETERERDFFQLACLAFAAMFGWVLSSMWISYKNKQYGWAFISSLPSVAVFGLMVVVLTTGSLQHGMVPVHAPTMAPTDTWAPREYGYYDYEGDSRDDSDNGQYNDRDGNRNNYQNGGYNRNRNVNYNYNYNTDNNP